ncbi:hypothetical protein Lser_V15G43120 [Lactuca serriola]
MDFKLMSVFFCILLISSLFSIETEDLKTSSTTQGGSSLIQTLIKGRDLVHRTLVNDLLKIRFSAETW